MVTFSVNAQKVNKEKKYLDICIYNYIPHDRSFLGIICRSFSIDYMPANC